MQSNLSDRKLLTGLFFRLLPYQVLLIVINAVNGIVDSLYASNGISNGNAAMSAIGLFGPLNHLLYAMSIMLVSGSQILYGRYLARDRERINSVLTVDLVTALIMSAATSLLLVLLVLTGATRLFVDQQPHLQMFNDYLLGQAIGIPALVLGQQLFAFLSLENQTRRTMTASIVCFCVNAVLDHVMITVVNMGTFGLGLSSSIAAWVFFGIQAWYYLRGRSEWKFRLSLCKWKDAPQIMRLGYPGALSRFVEMLARMLFTISIGEEDRRSIADIMKIVMSWGELLVLVMVAGLVLCAEPLTRLFYQDPSDPVYHYTVMGFRLLPLCMPLSLPARPTGAALKESRATR